MWLCVVVVCIDMRTSGRVYTVRERSSDGVNMGVFFFFCYVVSPLEGTESAGILDWIGLGRGRGMYVQEVSRAKQILLCRRWIDRGVWCRRPLLLVEIVELFTNKIRVIAHGLEPDANEPCNEHQKTAEDHHTEGDWVCAAEQCEMHDRVRQVQ